MGSTFDKFSTSLSYSFDRLNSGGRIRSAPMLRLHYRLPEFFLEESLTAEA